MTLQALLLPLRNHEESGAIDFGSLLRRGDGRADSETASLAFWAVARGHVWEKESPNPRPTIVLLMFTAYRSLLETTSSREGLLPSFFTRLLSHNGGRRKAPCSLLPFSGRGKTIGGS
jgi:hypothetical protein